MIAERDVRIKPALVYIRFKTKLHYKVKMEKTNSRNKSLKSKWKFSESKKNQAKREDLCL